MVMETTNFFICIWKHVLLVDCLLILFLESFGNDNFPLVKGDEVTLQKALHVVHKNTNDYVALLFYASWCPFSGTFRPSFSALSSLFPSIPHFAIEESAVRPRSGHQQFLLYTYYDIANFWLISSYIFSILSKYGVLGLPTLFLLNSTMRVRYHGSRTLDSLISFYSNVTGKTSTFYHLSSYSWKIN